MTDAALTSRVRTLHAIAMRDFDRAVAWAERWRPDASPPYRLRRPRAEDLAGLPSLDAAAGDAPPLVAEWVHRFEVADRTDPGVTTVWASTVWVYPDEDMILPEVTLKSDSRLYEVFRDAEASQVKKE